MKIISFDEYVDQIHQVLWEEDPEYRKLVESPKTREETVKGYFVLDMIEAGYLIVGYAEDHGIDIVANATGTAILESLERVKRNRGISAPTKEQVEYEDRLAEAQRAQLEPMMIRALQGGSKPKPTLH